jgi:hypothetical protein
VTANDTETIIFRLGVLLLELCTGEAREDLSNGAESFNAGGQCGAIAEFRTVYQWWEREALKEEGAEYAEAIRKCICFDFSCEQRSLLDEEFRRTMYSEIVLPLADVARQFKY